VGRDIHRIGRAKPQRYRFAEIVEHRGKKVQQRLGFIANKVVEVGYFPMIRRKR
jgi:hypothetical protein